ncbi:hypothetical protein O181_111741 [Austropuccinia psidii MF-1]|uniref:Uncharacterized protein n=1 Tax=Austropuccinia psidii MF-1 TaxID=1389203 RepID=A0A9Q3K115_9BASI|nr:hypothetical protein [Austropuccinia psidii MF-1]
MSQHKLHHISISKPQQTTNQDSRTLPRLTNPELFRVKFKTPPKLIIQALDLLEKGPASIIHQLFSEHSPLNTYLYQIKQVTSPICAHCSAPETTSHYLLYCRNYCMQQKELKQKIRKHKI